MADLIRMWTHRVRRSGTEQRLESSPDPSSEPQTMYPDVDIKAFNNPDKFVVDIIFVDDRVGGREKTWMAKALKKSWPPKSPPKDIGDSRLLEFIYDAPAESVADLISEENIRHHATRLLEAVAALRQIEEDKAAKTLSIIFVAHGFGGLICERALAIAEKQQQNIFQWTRGIILLNTPHYRAGLAEWATMSARAIGLSKKVKQKVWIDLKDQFDAIVAMQDAFCELVKARNKDSDEKTVRVTCCFELLSDPSEEPTLSPEWAILPAFRTFGLRRDRTLAMISSSEDKKDKKVDLLTAELLKWVKEITETEYQFLLNAARDGHEAEAEQTLAKRVNIIQGPALLKASEAGHERLVKNLLGKGVEADKEVALLAAAERGHEAVVRTLLENSAELDGSLALLVAAKRGQEAVVRILLDKGTNLNAKSEKYEKAYKAALFNGHEKVVQMLLDMGATVNKDAALIVASSRGNEMEVKKLLQEGADVDAKGGYHETPLLAATANGHKEVVQLLLNTGANPNSRGTFFDQYEGKDATKVTPLYTASCKGYESIVNSLLAKDAKVDEPAGTWGDALHVASAMGHDNIVQILLQKSAKVDKGDCLIFASENGHRKVVQTLLNSGVKDEKEMAIRAASRRGHTEIVQMLFSMVPRTERET